MTGQNQVTQLLTYELENCNAAIKFFGQNYRASFRILLLNPKNILVIPKNVRHQLPCTCYVFAFIGCRDLLCSYCIKSSFFGKFQTNIHILSPVAVLENRKNHQLKPQNCLLKFLACTNFVQEKTRFLESNAMTLLSFPNLHAKLSERMLHIFLFWDNQNFGSLIKHHFFNFLNVLFGSSQVIHFWEYQMCVLPQLNCFDHDFIWKYDGKLSLHTPVACSYIIFLWLPYFVNHASML